jgi:predicted lactoylglutathione lyase
MVRDALAAGGKTYAEPKDYGFMYQHGFQNLDGHIWEVFYMEPSETE